MLIWISTIIIKTSVRLMENKGINQIKHESSIYILENNLICLQQINPHCLTESEKRSFFRPKLAAMKR